jgi:cell wall-associated NlpC family hydrolase
MEHILLDIRLSRRILPALLLALAAMLSAAGGATAEPAELERQQARAQDVLAQVREMDAELGKAVESYNAANLRLAQIEADLARNRRHLVLARRNLGTAETRLAERVVALYVSGSDTSTVGVLLGAESLDDLIDRIETANRVSEQDASTLRQVIEYRALVKRQAAQLAKARIAQAAVVRQKAAQRASIESRIAERERMLAGIRSEIRRIQAAERQRSLAIARQLRSRPASSASTLGSSGSAPDGALIAPPSRYGGVVGIAMRYLGIPYKWGGASPSTGFDCSGFTQYVFAQIGVSLPHYTGAQWNMGTPVSRSQLEPGDLVFFNGLGHMGIYVGGGNFIHAPHTGDVVKISPLSGWYDQRYEGARRL